MYNKQSFLMFINPTNGPISDTLKDHGHLSVEIGRLTNYLWINIRCIDHVN